MTESVTGAPSGALSAPRFDAGRANEASVPPIGSLTIDRREQAWRLGGAAAAIVGGFALDLLHFGAISPSLAAHRALWGACFAVGAAATMRVPQRAVEVIPLLLGLVSVYLADAIVVVTGGVASPHFAWTIAFPFASAIIAVDRLRTVVLVGVAFSVGGALRVHLDGLPPLNVVAWGASTLLATALASWGALRYLQQRRAVLSVERQTARYEQELATAEERRLEMMRMEHVQQLADVGTAAAGLAHEIRNPLVVLMTAVEVLKRTAPDEHGLLGDMEHAIRHLEELTSTIGHAARPSGRDETHASIPDAVKDGMLLGRLRMTRVIEFDVRIDDPLPTVAMSPVRLVQVVSNLVGNACEALAASGEGNRVWVRARAAEDRVVLEVEDDGQGISPEDAERIFEPFVTSGAGEQNSGLGLALCRDYVAKAGGRIALEASAVGGARFVVHLPSSPGH